MERIMEGIPECVVDGGLINLDKLRDDNLSHADLFRALRFNEVEHLGQVKKAYFETSGQVSVIFQSHKATKLGLSILPEDEPFEGPDRPALLHAENVGYHSCQQCGQTEMFENKEVFGICDRYDCNNWSPSLT